MPPTDVDESTMCNAGNRGAQINRQERVDGMREAEGTRTSIPEDSDAARAGPRAALGAARLAGAPVAVSWPPVSPSHPSPPARPEPIHRAERRTSHSWGVRTHLCGQGAEGKREQMVGSLGNPLSLNLTGSKT